MIDFHMHYPSERDIAHISKLTGIDHKQILERQRVTQAYIREYLSGGLIIDGWGNDVKNLKINTTHRARYLKLSNPELTDEFIFKIYPDHEKIFVNDRRLWRMYQILNNREKVIIIHSNAEHSIIDYSNPFLIIDILEEFPKVRIVLAHLGGLKTGIYDCARHDNAFFDTGGMIINEKSRNVIKKIGTKKVLFGSDYPWCDPVPQIKSFDSFALRDKKLMLYENAKKILEI